MSEIEEVKKIFNVAQSLQLEGDQSLLGTGEDEAITIISDYDLQEIIDFDENDVGVKLYKKILNFFKNFYKEARENKTQYPVIPDFKCGVQAGGEPVRWNYPSIMKGYKILDNNEKVRFIDCLQQKSVIKIDYLVFIDDKYVEFSSNYYFNFGNATSYTPITTEKIIASLLKDAQSKIYEDGKLLKGLKRIYSALKLTDIDKKKLDFIISFLNSRTAEANKIVGDLELIPEVLDSEFRKVPMRIIKENIRTLANETPKKYKPYIKELLSINDIEDLKEQIENVKYIIMKDVNDSTERFMKQNEKKLNKLFTYGSIQSNK